MDTIKLLVQYLKKTFQKFGQIYKLWSISIHQLQVIYEYESTKVQTLSAELAMQTI